MPLTLDEHVMMTAVKEWLQTQFDTNPSNIPDYPQEGAAIDAEMMRNLRDPKDIEGLPTVAISLQNDVRSRWAGANGHERDCVINLECRANEFNGSLEGAENPEAAHIKMARAIRGFDPDLIAGTYPGLTKIQALGEDANTVKMRLFLTYNED